MTKLIRTVLIAGAYVLFGAAYLAYLAYTFVPLMDLVTRWVSPLSWFIKIPAFFAFGVVGTAIALVGAIPLFWMDRLTTFIQNNLRKSDDSHESERK